MTYISEYAERSCRKYKDGTSKSHEKISVRLCHPYLVGVSVGQSLCGVDGLVEEWVGECGVVELVVAVAAVAHQVEEDVAPEFALILKAELRGLHNILREGIYTLYMTNDISEMQHKRNVQGVEFHYQTCKVFNISPQENRR